MAAHSLTLISWATAVDSFLSKDNGICSMVTDYVEVSRVKTLYPTVSEQLIRFLDHLLEGQAVSILSGIPD